ncbi:MAG: ABC transporter permease [Pseudomonadota bacterium]
MKPKFLVVLQKELTEAVRDRRNLAIMLLLGAMLPALLGFALHRLIVSETRSEKEGIALVVIGAAQAPTLLAQLRQENVTVTERGEMGEADITALLRGKTVAGVLKLSPRFADDYRAMRPARIELWFDSAGEKDAQRRDLEHILRQYSIEIAGARLLAHGVSPATLSPIALQRYDTATGATRSNRIIGSMLGMLFIPAFVFGLSMVIDGTAGERERRSLEILMAQPARPFDLIAGKWLAASVLAVVGMSLELSAAHIMLKSLPLEEVGMSWRLSLPMLLSVIAVSVPLCLFATAIEIALAMNARTFKEAQSMMSFALMLPMLPMTIVPFLNLTTQNWMYLVPVLSNLTLFQELAKGQQVGALPFALTASSALALAALAIGFATWRLKSERYVLSV